MEYYFVIRNYLNNESFKSNNRKKVILKLTIHMGRLLSE